MEPPSHPVRCLVLACGNTLRGDDGVGPWLADWVEKQFTGEPSVRILSRHQWTPDLAEEIARAGSVVFVDCAVNVAPGAVRMMRVQPARSEASVATHHVGAAELLALSEELYASLPRDTLLLTIGSGSTELGETFSKAVNEALPEACRVLEAAVLRLLEKHSA